MNQKQDEVYKTPIYQQYVLIARNEINKILKYGNELKKPNTLAEREIGLNLAKILIKYIKNGPFKSAPKHSSWIYEVARIALKSINESSDLEKKVVEPFYSAMKSFSAIKNSKEKKQLSEKHKKSLNTVGQLFERMYTIFESEKLPEIYKKWEEYKTLEKEVLEEIKTKI